MKELKKTEEDLKKWYNEYLSWKSIRPGFPGVLTKGSMNQ